MRTKPTMLVINIVSLSILIAMGFLWWPIALLLSLGNFLGAKMVTGSMQGVAKTIVFVVPVLAALRLLTSG